MPPLSSPLTAAAATAEALHVTPLASDSVASSGNDTDATLDPPHVESPVEESSEDLEDILHHSDDDPSDPSWSAESAPDMVSKLLYPFLSRHS